MAVGDDGTVDYVASFGLSSSENKQSGDMLSPEVAWADSCLINDPVSDSSWESLKDALLETLHSQTDSAYSGRRDFSKEADLEVVGLSKEPGSLHNWDKAVDSNALTSERGEKIEDEHSKQNNDTFWSRINMKTMYNENLRDIGTFESDLGLLTFVIDQSHEDIFKVCEEPGSSHNWDKAVDNNASTSEGAEKTDNDHNNGDNDTLRSRINMENVFLPTYNENLRDFGTLDSDSDLDLPAFVVDQSDEDIFKVWDLDTPDEEDELIQQLNKALLESSLESSPTVFGDSTVSKVLKKEVDDLISGIADLSLIEDSV